MPDNVHVEQVNIRSDVSGFQRIRQAARFAFSGVISESRRAERAASRTAREFGRQYRSVGTEIGNVSRSLRNLQMEFERLHTMRDMVQEGSRTWKRLSEAIRETHNEMVALHQTQQRLQRLRGRSGRQRDAAARQRDALQAQREARENRQALGHALGAGLGGLMSAPEQLFGGVAPTLSRLGGVGIEFGMGFLASAADLGADLVGAVLGEGAGNLVRRIGPGQLRKLGDIGAPIAEAMIAQSMQASQRIFQEFLTVERTRMGAIPFVEGLQRGPLRAGPLGRMAQLGFSSAEALRVGAQFGQAAGFRLPEGYLMDVLERVRMGIPVEAQGGAARFLRPGGGARALPVTGRSSRMEFFQRDILADAIQQGMDASAASEYMLLISQHMNQMTTQGVMIDERFVSANIRALGGAGLQGMQRMVAANAIGGVFQQVGFGQGDPLTAMIALRAAMGTGLTSYGEAVQILQRGIGAHPEVMTRFFETFAGLGGGPVRSGDLRAMMLSRRTGVGMDILIPILQAAQRGELSPADLSGIDVQFPMGVPPTVQAAETARARRVATGAELQDVAITLMDNLSTIEIQSGRLGAAFTDLVEIVPAATAAFMGLVIKGAETIGLLDEQAEDRMLNQLQGVD